MPCPRKTIKGNVYRFDDDVRRTGAYAYTAGKLSSRYANARISEGIFSSYSFPSKKVLDLGCGDGTYTLEIAVLGASEILGVDPAEVAVGAAAKKSRDMGYADKVRFEVGNIYTLEEQLGTRRFDCVVLRGVLHHLPDPAKAIACVAFWADTVIILEPNGYNPVLKMLERFSRYHVEHEERSFFSGTLRRWSEAAGLRVVSRRYLNLVPMFCPDWMAKICKKLEPLVERIPLLREIFCGQCIIVATKY